MNKLLTDLGIEFVNDEQVIGKWHNIGWIDSTTDCSLENLQEKDGDFEEIYFLTNEYELELIDFNVFLSFST